VSERDLGLWVALMLGFGSMGEVGVCERFSIDHWGLDWAGSIRYPTCNRIHYVVFGQSIITSCFRLGCKL